MNVERGTTNKTVYFDVACCFPLKIIMNIINAFCSKKRAS